MTNLAAPSLTSLQFVTPLPVSPSFFDTFDNGNRAPIGPVARMTNNKFKRVDAARRWAQLNESTKLMAMRHHGDERVRRKSDQWECADTLLTHASKAAEKAQHWEKETAEPLNLSATAALTECIEWHRATSVSRPTDRPQRPPPSHPPLLDVLKPYRVVGVSRVDARKNLLKELRVPSSMTSQKRRETERRALLFLEKRREEQQTVQRHEMKRKEGRRKEWDEDLRAFAQLTARTPDPWVAVKLSPVCAVAWKPPTEAYNHAVGPVTIHKPGTAAGPVKIQKPDPSSGTSMLLLRPL